MVIQSMAASHAAGKGSEPDSVFAVVAKVRAAKQQPGAETIVDGSIGAIHDEKGNFSVLPSVHQSLCQMSPDELMNYATITGSPEFLQSAIDYTFQGFQPPDAIAKAVGTPGGTGAVRLMIYNYLNNGEAVLIPDWHWAPYETIAQENQRIAKTYEMFDENLQFTTKDIKAKVKEVLAKQDNLLIIFNTPGHNPTGYSLSLDDWADLIPFFKECAQDTTKHIVIGLDMAYVDYCGDAKEARRFLGMFADLPENMMVLIAFSMSKSFLVYGMRSGALIGFSTSQAVMQDFSNINSFSGRGIWSNGNRGAQQLLVRINHDAELAATVDAQRAELAQLVSDRAAIFVKEAAAVDLKILPYFGGFFITIPTKDPKALLEKLEAKGIFLVPMGKGVRLAVCAVPKTKIPGLAARIKEELQTLEV
jgi:aromatic-amino-acid transaminase